MYEITLLGVEVVDGSSDWNGQKIDLHITPTCIAQGSGGKIYDASGLKVSVGWVDMRAALMETLKDSPQHLAHSAAAGGFTHVGVFSNSEFELDSPEAINSLMQMGCKGVNFLALGAIAHQNQINELGLLSQAGCKTFSSGHESSLGAPLLLTSLLYGKMFGSLVCSMASDYQISPKGQINEGMISVATGLTGIPNLAEELALQKIISILAYTQGKIHVNCIGTQKGFELIQQAKNQELNITCDAAAYQFYFTDKDLANFDTSLKVYPPLRSDTQIVWRALRNGILDAICSNHIPQDSESKKLEFDLASFGMLGLETFFGALISTKPADIELSTLLDLFTRKPRKILGLPQPKVSQNQIPDLTLFDDSVEWQVSHSDIKSKSKNSPFLGRYLKGKSMGIFSPTGCYLSQEMKSREL